MPLRGGARRPAGVVPGAPFRSILDAMAEGVVVVGADGRVVRVNPAASRILQSPPEALVGLPVPFPGWTSWGEDGTPYSGDEWPLVITHRTGRPMRRLLMGTRGAGDRERWLEVSSEPVGADGPPFAVVVTFADVSERVAAERALRASEGRFRSLVESMGEGLLVHAPDGRIELANPAALRLLGRPEAHVVDRGAMQEAWGLVDAGGRPLALDEAPPAVTRVTGRRVSGALLGLTRPGREHLWAEVNTAPVGDGPPYRVVVTFADVSARVEAERALRESEARYRLLAEHSGDQVLRHDADSTITYASPAAERVFGWPPEDLVGRMALELTHPDDMPEMGRARAELDRGRACTIRVRGIGARGDVRWLEITLSPVMGPDGRLAEVVSVTRDVSAQVAAEDALRASEAQYRVLAENASDVIARSSPDGVVLYVSPSVERVTGFPPESMVGRSWAELVHPDDRALVASLRAGTGGAPPVRVRTLRADGGWTWVEATAALVGDAGRPAEIVTVVRQVDQQVDAERALRESEARFRLVAENASDVILRVGPDDRILWVSPSVQRVTGHRPEDLVGRLPVDLAHPDDAGRLLLHAGLPIRPGSVALARFRTAAGGYIWGEVTYNPVRHPDGGLAEVHATVRDVTVRVEMEERERGRAREREELMALVSQELRAPLGALDGLLWLIGEDAGGMSARGRRRLESARTRLSRLRRLASDLVVMTQLDARALRLRRADVDLGALVQDLAASAGLEAERAGLRLETRVRATPVLADEGRVAQVVDNLLSNALKFSPPGGTVRLDVDGDPRWGRVVVTDEGPGVPAGDRERVLERFQRGAGLETVPGSGLGLAIARAIAEAHGGRIRLEDGPGGRGLRAALELPRE